MIEEKINNSLKALEKELKDIESARKQVEMTVNSYDGFNKTTRDYVIKLGNIANKIQEIVDTIGKDYDQKVLDFEKERETIVKTATSASEKLSNATEEFKVSLFELKTKLKYSLILNALTLVAIIVIVIFLLK